MSFPRNRFLEAGATPEAVDEIQAAFDTLAPAVQQAMEERWASLASGDLAAELSPGETASTGGGEQPQDPADAGLDATADANAQAMIADEPWEEPEPDPEAESEAEPEPKAPPGKE